MRFRYRDFHSLGTSSIGRVLVDTKYVGISCICLVVSWTSLIHTDSHRRPILPNRLAGAQYLLRHQIRHSYHDYPETFLLVLYREVAQAWLRDTQRRFLRP
jgi:hypothetical protein